MVFHGDLLPTKATLESSFGGLSKRGIQPTMSMELDSGTVRELSNGIHNLNVSVAELKTLIGQFGPILTQQVNGLTNMENRVTRIEDKISFVETRQNDIAVNLDQKITALKADMNEKIAALDKKMAEEKQEAAELAKAAEAQRDKQITTNRWLIVLLISVIAGAVGLATFLIKHIDIKP